MRNLFLVTVLTLLTFGCDNSEPKVTESPIEKKADAEKKQKPETVAAHTLDKETDAKVASDATKKEPTSDNAKGKPKFSAGGDPIDTTSYDAEIAEAEKKLKADTSNEDLKKNLSEAFTKRGVALTSARQYAAAVGDYRKALKLDSSNKIAKTWLSQIEGIYQSLPNKEMPKEGEEPKPLEFKKGKA